jgi:excisionase family DNA binding protein
MALIRVSEAARELDCSTEHIYRMIRAGKLKVSRGLGPKSTRLSIDQIIGLKEQPTAEK